MNDDIPPEGTVARAFHDLGKAINDLLDTMDAELPPLLRPIVRLLRWWWVG